MNAGDEHDARWAAQRIAMLEDEVARLRAQAKDESVATEVRARLAHVGAAGVLSAPTEHTALLEQIVQTAMHVLHAHAGALYLLDEESEELVFEVALGGGGAPLRGRRLAPGQGIAGWVAATGQAIATTDVQQDPRWSQEFGRLVGYTPQTMLTMPLLLRDRVVGVLQLLDKESGEPFSTDDMVTLSLFAQQAAVAITQSGTVRNLSALLRVLLADEDPTPSGDPAETAAFVAQTEESAEYHDTLQLAAYLAEIAHHDDAGRRLCLEVVGAIVNYLRTRPQVHG